MTVDPTPLFPQRLKKARVSKGWSQRDLAQRMALSQARISSLERGDQNALHGQVAQLATLFQCTADWLLGRSDDGGPPTASPVPTDAPESSIAA